METRADSICLQHQVCLISQLTSEANQALESQRDNLIIEASIELSRRREQVQHLQAELQVQVVFCASESQQAAAMLQQTWDTIQQENEQFRSHYEERRDTHTSAFQDVSRAGRNRTQLYTELKNAAG